METPANRVDDSAMIYHINIRAGFNPQTKGVSFGSDGATITTQFATTDNVYVYNETKKAFARTRTNAITAPLISLHPRNISGAYCELIGDLTFYIWDDSLGEFGEWTPIAVEDGDSYSLFYQMNLPSEGSSMFPLFDYSDQNGSVTSASTHDFAEATGLVLNKTASSLTIPDGVVLNNIQSMFRLRLSYTDGGTALSPAPTVLGLSVSTKNGTLVKWYLPTKPEKYDWDVIPLDIPVVFSGNNDVFLSLAFQYGSTDHLADDDELILTATDSNNNVFQGSLTVPSGGFVNSKYYYGAVTLSKQVQRSTPTVTRTDGGDEDELNPDANGVYYFSDASNPAYVTISGDSDNYFFEFQNNAIVTLTGNGHASSTATDEDFIFSYNGNLTIALGSDYSINCGSYETAITCQRGKIQLCTTTGIAQTLTITTNDDDVDFGGFSGFDNDDFYYCGTLSDIAASGFTVTRTTTDNQDGTYTWIYTVTPNP